MLSQTTKPVHHVHGRSMIAEQLFQSGAALLGEIIHIERHRQLGVNDPRLSEAAARITRAIRLVDAAQRLLTEAVR